MTLRRRVIRSRRRKRADSMPWARSFLVAKGDHKMKRITVILGIAAFVASAAPMAAQGNGGKYGRNNGSIYDTNGDGRIDSRDRAQQSNCAWYDVNCAGVNSRNTRNDVRNSTGWQLIGRDLDGYSLYERRTYERNGKSTIETARQLPD